MTTNNACNSRGSVLLAVLIVVAIGAIIGTSVMLRAQSHRALASVGVRRTQTNALAWSGVNAVMAEMAAQREAILDGAEPSLTLEWELFRDGAWRGVVRLVPAGKSGGVCTPENARLDVNLATTEMLASLPGVDDALGERIIGARGQGLSSIEPLRVLVAGMRSVDASTASLSDSVGGIGAGRAIDAAAGGSGDGEWIDHLTVFSFDPDVQAGVAGNEAGKGLRRVGLSGGWTTGARSAVVDRFGEDIARVAEAIFKDAPPMKKDSELVALLRRVGATPKDWGPALDFFATSPDEYRIGRVDVNRASAAVLACIPGIDAAAAAKIVEARESHSASTRLNVVWPAAEGILTEEQFERAVDWLCVRTTQWRVRIEAGLLPADDVPDSLGRSPRDDRGGSRDAGIRMSGSDLVPMMHAVILEAVVDVSGRRPRLAYLRDVTYIREASELRAQIEAGKADDPPPAAPPEPAPEMSPRPRARRDTLHAASARSEPQQPGEEPGTNERGGAGGAEQAPVDRRIGRWTPGRKG